ncbi:MAG: hypothetical protein HQK51_07910 [Oligoflexia bacterium]|nr:hypothetical protein [Oligoflexia bacterium]
MKTLKHFLFATLLVSLSMISAFAEPTSQTASKIVMFRSYSGGDVFIHLADNIICNTSVFKIQGSEGNKMMASTAMSAFLSGRQVSIEIPTSGCTGWGTEVLSIYVH